MQRYYKNDSIYRGMWYEPKEDLSPVDSLGGL